MAGARQVQCSGRRRALEEAAEMWGQEGMSESVPRRGPP